MKPTAPNNSVRYGVLAVVVIAIGVFLAWSEKSMNAYTVRILNLCGIYIGVALGLNLINGLTGQFSLGIAGFMSVGAYTTALLTMSPQVKEMVFFIDPLIAPLNQLQVGFLPALAIAAILSGAAGFLVAAPALRFRGDYLAIVTLGFAEIIRVVFTNTRSITNGALGLKGIPARTTLLWSWGFALLCLYVMVRLVSSTYGRALKAIRDNEVAAESMGIDLFRHKSIAFVVSSMMAGVGGGLLACLITTIDPNMFRFPLTFIVLMMVVLGGMGNITGTVISASLVTVALEVFRALEQPINLFGLRIPGVPGMRMVIFSTVLLIVIIFYRRGLMGDRELSWSTIDAIVARVRRGRGGAAGNE